MGPDTEKLRQKLICPDYGIFRPIMMAYFEKSEMFGLNMADKDALAVTKDWV